MVFTHCLPFSLLNQSGVSGSFGPVEVFIMVHTNCDLHDFPAWLDFVPPSVVYNVASAACSTSWVLSAPARIEVRAPGRLWCFSRLAGVSRALQKVGSSAPESPKSRLRRTPKAVQSPRKNSAAGGTPGRCYGQHRRPKGHRIITSNIKMTLA